MVSRTSQKRQQNTREAQERAAPSTVRKGKLAVPDEIVAAEKKKGFDVAWIALSVHNHPLDGNVETKLMNGWAWIPADDYPRLVPPTLPGRDKPMMIQRGGQILCRKPTEQVLADRAAVQAENMEALNSVNWSDGDNKVPQLGSRETLVNQTKIERVVTSNAGFKD